MRESGRRVPEDVSVAGFDDAPQSAFYAPSLTTVRQDFVGLGRDCFRLLRRQHDRQAQAEAPSVSDPELIVRASTGPPSRGARRG
jgi:DNA-binding LacI/PurR family transcriptional regulator